MADSDNARAALPGDLAAEMAAELARLESQETEEPAELKSGEKSGARRAVARRSCPRAAQGLLALQARASGRHERTRQGQELCLPPLPDPPDGAVPECGPRGPAKAEQSRKAKVLREVC